METGGPSISIRGPFTASDHRGGQVSPKTANKTQVGSSTIWPEQDFRATQMRKPTTNTIPKACPHLRMFLGSRGKAYHGRSAPRERESVTNVDFVFSWNFFRTAGVAYPLCPAGHLPRKEGDWLGGLTPLNSRRERWPEGCHESISPPEGEMPGRAEGVATHSEQPTNRGATPTHIPHKTQKPRMSPSGVLLLD
ncbi:hypothetical protein GGQ73_004006 [Rhizobium skierniewicense]|uniref:Uncharacterized protein n=1 Tax=Rhizobium skierniewicense TaxID=984260 RepID=A0A7W6CDR0_9HYPH|nr:hypothetical protein [Rhizobium skierniewicense]